MSMNYLRRVLGGDAPCKDCQDRCLYCHSSCERYNAWKAAEDEKNRKERERKMQYQYAFNSATYYAGKKKQGKM